MDVLTWASDAAAVLISVTFWLSSLVAACDRDAMPALVELSASVTVVASCRTTERAAELPGLLASADQEFQNELSCSAMPLSLGSSKSDCTPETWVAAVCA
jgi:hypothetical protein